MMKDLTGNEDIGNGYTTPIESIGSGGLDSRFEDMWKKIGSSIESPHNTTEDVEIMMFKNVYTPKDDEVAIVKADEHNGMTLNRIFKHINSIITV